MREIADGERIGLVLIGSDRDLASFGDDPADELSNTSPGRLGMGSPMFLFECSTFHLLRGPHGAATTQFRLVYAVNKVRDPDQQVEIEWPVLAVLEGPKPVENKWLFRGRCWAKLLVEQKAVTPEALGLALQGAVGDSELATDLPEARAADQTMEEWLKQLGVPQPIGW